MHSRRVLTLPERASQLSLVLTIYFRSTSVQMRLARQSSLIQPMGAKTKRYVHGGK